MKDTPDLLTHDVEFTPKKDVPIDPTQWVAQANAVRQSLAADGLASDQMVEALNGFRFRDGGGQTWTYNGTAWMTWNGSAWVSGSPPSALHLQPFKLEWTGDVPPVAPSAHAAEAASHRAVPAPPAPPHLAPGHDGSKPGGGHLPPPPPPPPPGARKG